MARPTSCSQFVRHFLCGGGICWGWVRVRGEILPPVFVVWFASGGDVRLNAQSSDVVDIFLTEIAIVQRSSLGLTDGGGDSLQGRHRFLLVVGMVGQGVPHYQQTILVYGYLHIVVLVKARVVAIRDIVKSCGLTMIRRIPEYLTNRCSILPAPTLVPLSDGLSSA